MTEGVLFDSIDERLLGHIINRPSGAREVFRKITDAGYFDGKTNQWVFAACKRVFDKQSPAPMILTKDMVVGELQAMGVWKDVDKDAFNRISEAQVNAKDFPATMKTVMERHKTTEIDRHIGELATADVEKRAEIVERLTELQRETSVDNGEKILTLDDWLSEVDQIDEMPDCVPTGFPVLDRKLGGGWSKGGYHIISAPPGTGKTILMLTAWKSMLDQGIPSIYINYEISRGLFMKFMFAQFTGVNVQQPERYSYEEIEVAKQDFKKIVADLFDRNLLLITDPMAGSSKYWNDIEEMLREFSEDYGAQAVFFDTVNSVGARTRKGQDQRWNEYELIAREAENLCQSLNIVMVLSAQQDMESIKRDDKTPQLGDVAGSKTLTEKAASVIHILRTDLHEKMSGIDYSELHVTKNRMMGTEMGTSPVRVKYDARFKRLYEVEVDSQQSVRGTMDEQEDAFPTPKDIAALKKHPTLQIDIEEGKEL
jgi:replicative DNA helicase